MFRPLSYADGVTGCRRNAFHQLATSFKFCVEKDGLSVWLVNATDTVGGSRRWRVVSDSTWGSFSDKNGRLGFESHLLQMFYVCNFPLFVRFCVANMRLHFP